MALSLSSKPFLGASRTEGLSGFCSLFSDLRKLSFPSVQFSVRPRTLKKLQVKAAGSAFGNHFRVTTYGESRRDGVGCVIDGAPPRRPLSEADLQADLNRIRRRPGQISRITNPRNETDTCKILSGVHEGLTTGTPIYVFVPNRSERTRLSRNLGSL